MEQNWATLQGGEMTIQTTQASEATQAVASLAEAAVAASQEMQPGATVTMALNRWGWGEVDKLFRKDEDNMGILFLLSSGHKCYVLTLDKI